MGAYRDGQMTVKMFTDGEKIGTWTTLPTRPMKGDELFIEDVRYWVYKIEIRVDAVFIYCTDNRPRS